MSNKRDNKTNASKKVDKNKTISNLKLDNDVDDIDINKIRVSEARAFMKKNNLYKHYIFYEDVGKYIPLDICFSKTLAGYYNEYCDEDGKYDRDVSKRMNFVISDDLVDRVKKKSY